jgi:hypothetical protein
MDSDVKIHGISEKEKADKRRRYQENREIIRAQQKTYYDKNRDAMKTRTRKYKLEHATEDAAKDKEYYEKNRDAILEQKRIYHENNKERAAKYKKQYNIDHKDEVSKRRRDYYEKNRDKILTYARKNRAVLWERARDFFGPCSCCGEHRTEFLSIDHINGNGTKLRKAGEGAGWALLSKFNKAGWPIDLKKEYRLLCHNCNQSIGYLGYCPHEFERNETSEVKPKTKGFPSQFQC